MQSYARVVNCSICIACHFPDVIQDPHLTIEEETVPVAPDNATAVSYVWGEFDRQKRAIGHYWNGTAVFVELGADWDVNDYIRALDLACNDQAFAFGHRYLWIDQLCIKQTDQHEIGKSLSKIPDIFRAFDVLVLLQGGPCTCWTDILDMLQEEKIQSFLRAVPVELCLNISGFTSWSARVWTRQELYNARRVRARWVSQSVACPSAVRNRKQTQIGTAGMSYFEPSAMDRMSLPARLHLERQLTTTINSNGTVKSSDDAQMEVVASLRSFISTQLGAATDDLITWRTGVDINGPRHSSSNRIRYLLNFFNEDLIISVRMTQFTAIDFLTLLHNQIQRRLTATKPRDYVLSVWIFCPGYQLPMDSGSLSTVRLLEDGIDQFATFSGHMLSLAPAGLFNTSDSSFAWRPSQYLDFETVEQIRDVYGALFPDPQAYVPGASGVRISSATSLQWEKTTLISFAAMLDAMSPSDALKWLTRYSKYKETDGTTFEDYCHTNMQLFLGDTTPRPYTTALRNVLQHIHTARWGGTPPDEAIGSDPNWSLLLQQIFCVASGLPLHTASQHNLEVLVDTHDTRTARVGLFRHDIRLLKETFTVRMLHAPNTVPKTLEYEITPCTEQKGSKFAQYRVVGVWLPHHRGATEAKSRQVYQDPAQAYADPDGKDGIIV